MSYFEEQKKHDNCRLSHITKVAYAETSRDGMYIYTDISNHIWWVQMASMYKHKHAGVIRI